MTAPARFTQADIARALRGARSAGFAEVAAITGQTHQIVEHYAAKVNRRRLGKAAIVKLEASRKKSA